jgi:hypothetical protein
MSFAPVANRGESLRICRQLDRQLLIFIRRLRDQLRQTDRNALAVGARSKVNGLHPVPFSSSTNMSIRPPGCEDGLQPKVQFGGRRYIIIVAFGLIVLGAWHHLYFSYLADEFACFKNAYDEDTYLLWPFGPGGVRVDRVLSGTVVSILAWLSRGSCGFTLATLDATLPAVLFLAAYYLASVFHLRFSLRVLFALVLVFCFDLLSLGSIAAYPGAFSTLTRIAALFSEHIVPPFEISYLSIYRSPEPQISWVMAFLFVGVLLRFLFRASDVISRTDILRLVVVQSVLMISYALVSYPLLVVEGCTAVLLIFARRPQKALLLGALCLGSALPAAIFGRMTIGPSFLFASRLPVITVGVVLALGLTVAFGFRLLRSGRFNARLATGLAFSITPLVLTNQQLVTGTMASARDWERYIDIPFCVIAFGILMSHGRRIRRLPDPAIALAIIAIVLFVSAASWRTFEFWLPDNLKSLAIARAIRSAGAALDPEALLVFDQPEYVPAVEARLGRPINALLSYTEIFKHVVPPATGFNPTPLSRSLFEFWRQTGISPDAAKDILEREISERGGYYSGFLFSLCEYWYPCSDGRNVKTATIRAALPSVIASYAVFLTKPAPPLKFAFVSSSSTPSAAAVEIGQGRAGPVTAKLWLRN